MFTLKSQKDRWNIPWLEYGIGERLDIDISVSVAGLFKKAMHEKKTLRTMDLSTSLDLEEVASLLADEGYYLAYSCSSEEQDIEIRAHEDVGARDEVPTIKGFFSSEDGTAALFFSSGKNYSDVYRYVSIATTDGEKISRFKDVFNPHKAKQVKDQKSSVMMMISIQEGFEIRKTGRVGCAFNENYYSNSVKESFKFIVEEYKKEIPRGKITIISGPPGTGKTYLIRALINAVGERASFVIIPASMVKNLGEPAMLPALLNKAKGGRPTVLVLEDADILLKERGDGSIDSISTALNMGDGILGDLCNIRLLITTNQPIEKIDDAMKRPGRLSISCVVGELNKEEIKMAWNDIAAGAEMPKYLEERSSASIAEIFQLKVVE